MQGTTRTITLKVDDIPVGKSIAAIKKDFKELKKEVEEATERNDEYYEKVARLAQLKKYIKKHNKNINGTRKAWASAKQGAEGFMSKLANKAGWAAIVAGVGLVVQKFAAATYQTIKLQGEVKRLTGLAGTDLRKVAAGVGAIASTFEQSNQEVSIAVKRLMDYGLTGQQALQLIEQGFLAGADSSGEFLENIDEYATQYQRLNYTADEFVEILTKQAQLTYNDYGSDFIKEFGILFTTEKDKLVERLQHFNSDVQQIFSKDLIKSIQTGEIGAKESLNRIITDIEKLPPKSEAATAAINRVFGTKGEDNSEEFIRAINDVEGNLDKLIDKTDNLTTAQRNQLALQKNLNTIKQRFANIISSTVLPALSSMVGHVSDYIQQPYSEQLQEEQVELNTLVNMLQLNIDKQDVRNRLINEIQDKYPGFLKNMDTEKLSYSQLSTRLKEVNQQYIQRILLQQQQEKIEAARNKVANITAKEFKKEKKLVESLNKVAQQYNFTFKEGEDIAARYSKAQEILRKNENGLGVVFNKALRQRRQLSELYHRAGGGLRSLNSQHEKEEKNIISLQNEYQELIKYLEQKGIVQEAISKRDVPAENQEKQTKSIAANNKKRQASAKQYAEKRQEIEVEMRHNLNAELKRLRREAQLAKMNEEDAEIARIEQQYDLIIQKAKKHNDPAAAVELERLKHEAVERYLEKQHTEQEEKETAALEAEEEKALQQHEEQLQQQLQRDNEKLNQREELQRRIKELTSTEQERQLAALDEQYNILLARADEFGIDVTDLEIAHLEARAELKEKFAKEEKDREKAKQDKILKDQEEALAKRAQLYQNLGQVISNALDVFAQEESEFLEFQRLASMAQIAFDTATAISSVVTAASSTSITPIDLAIKVTAGIATVLANIAKAKELLTTPVPQKYMGGFHDVTGADDGKRYSANYLGRPSTGMLPPGPQLILANERGIEYFVDNPTLQIPEALHHINAIEAIRTGQQRVTGGFTESPAPTRTPPPAPSTNTDTALMQQLNENIILLNTLLAAGIDARVLLNDDTLVDIASRMKIIEDLRA